MGHKRATPERPLPERQHHTAAVPVLVIPVAIDCAGDVRVQRTRAAGYPERTAALEGVLAPECSGGELATGSVLLSGIIPIG